MIVGVAAPKFESSSSFWFDVSVFEDGVQDIADGVATR